MPRPLKTDIPKLRDLHAKGLSVTRIAKELGVSKGTVSKQLKHLNLAATKNILVEQAPKFVEQKLDAMAQLKHINEVANNLIDELTGEEETINKLAQGVQALLAFKGEPTKENLEELKCLILKLNQDRNTIIKACAEVRGQIALLVDISKTLYNMEVVSEYHEELIELLRQTSPKLRDDFLARVKERQALRRALKNE